ncbi:hypothetical protein K2P56_04990 [Patescibacteria group bacterium]|nr:hypothetical protein [Patescibacteria group bacterium]
MRVSKTTLSIGLLFILLAVFFGPSFLLSTFSEDSSVSSARTPVKIRSDLEESLKILGPKKAYAALKEKYGNEEFNHRHNVAHLFGEALYYSAGLKGVEVCDTDFNFGCYHGFLIRAIAENGLGVIETLDASCLSLETRPAACQHGLGHGIYEYFGSEKLVEALQMCKKTKQLHPLAGCVPGVFMANNILFTLTEQGNYKITPRELPNGTSPYAPCPEMPIEFQASCYHELPQWWYEVYSHDFSRMVSLCEGVPITDGRVACFAAVGIVKADDTTYRGVPVAELCATIPSYDGEVQCATQGAWAIHFNGTDPAREAGLACSKLKEVDKKGCPQ